MDKELAGNVGVGCRVEKTRAPAQALLHLIARSRRQAIVCKWRQADHFCLITLPSDSAGHVDEVHTAVRAVKRPAVRWWIKLHKIEPADTVTLPNTRDDFVYYW